MKIRYYYYSCMNIQIILRTDSKEIIDKLDFLLQYSFEYSPTCVPRSTNYYITIIEKQGSYILSWGDTKYNKVEQIFSFNLLWGIIYEFLFSEIIAYHSQFLLLHSTAVQFKGYTFVFVAESTTGKSTFAANLCNYENCNYITDDVLPVRKSDLMACSLNKPIALRKNSPFYNNKLSEMFHSQSLYLNNGSEGRRLVFPQKRVINRDFFPIHFIIKLNRAQLFDSADIEKIPKQQALVEIMKSIIFSDTKDISMCIMKLLKSCDFFQLNYHYSENIDIENILNLIIRQRTLE